MEQIEVASTQRRAKVLEKLRRLDILSWADVGLVVSAYVNHNRWVADCPCGGAELVAPAERFVCGSCGRSAEVVWPDERAELEGALEPRPPQARNWRRPETVDDLLAENASKGVA